MFQQCRPPPTLNTLIRTRTRTLNTATNNPTTTQTTQLKATRRQFKASTSIFDELDPPYDPQTYAKLFHSCASSIQLRLGQLFHHHMLSRATQPDLYTNNHLINMYSKCGDLKTARKLFDKMPQRNIFSWTTLISGYSQLREKRNCFVLFSQMLGYCEPNDFAYASVLSVCELREGVQVHGISFKSGFSSWVYVGNALITMYANGGLCDEAVRVFRGLEFENVVSYNAVIAGCRICGQGGKGVGMFLRMYNDGGIGFDRATILSVVSAVCECDESDSFNVLRFCLQLHSLCLKSGFILDMAVVTALVKAYSCLGVEVGRCYKLFLEAGDKQRDIILWTGIMSAFSEKDPDGTIFLFRELRRAGGVPDCYAFSVVLKACAGLVTDSHPLSVHCQVIKSGVAEHVVLGNALIHAYARSGSMTNAKKIFSEMVSRDVVSWNTILKAYALHGQSLEALKLFDQMDVKPDATTFVAMLSACSHTGMVEEGKRLFNTMLGKYGVAPKLDHYACMVDILGRAGHVYEAEKLIGEMPIEPDYVVWSALLGASKKHGETQLASLAVSKLKELDPNNSLGYVTLSNVYCSAGSFDEADLLRKKMKRLGIQKEPGLSWTKVGKHVHEFASGGREHPQGEAIRAYTKEIVTKIKEVGYVPDTSLPSQDVEDEHKEEQLYYHSEKLALMFNLMNAQESDCSIGVIKIMKNIRTCLDCHNFMKYASAFVQKEIVVRDSNRFHHFKEGMCSCNDYW